MVDSIVYEGPIVDAHSHIGHDLNWPLKGILPQYQKTVESIGVVHSVISPCPTPIYTGPRPGITKHVKYCPSAWSFDEARDPQLRFYTSDENGNPMKSPHRDLFLSASFSPYQKANAELVHFAEVYPISVSACFHPWLSVGRDMIDLLENPKVVGVKIHGVATHSPPSRLDGIKQYIPREIKKAEKVLTVHTDFSAKPDDYFEQMYAANNPNVWLDLAEQTKIKMYLTHGLRGDISAIERANEMGNVLIGISPSLQLEPTESRLKCGNNYLETLFSNAEPKRLAFDIDYPWNVPKIIPQLEWDEKSRCEAVIGELGTWSNDDIKGFFFGNAVNHFNLSLEA